MKVTKSYQGNNEESSVTINEILVVKSTKSKITGMITESLVLVQLSLFVIRIVASQCKVIANKN